MSVPLLHPFPFSSMGLLMENLIATGALGKGTPFPPICSLLSLTLTILLDIEYFEDNITPINQVQPVITHLLYAELLMIY